MNTWWKKRLEYNYKMAERTLDGTIRLWWSIHSRDGKLDNAKLIQEVWADDAVKHAADKLSRAMANLSGNTRRDQAEKEESQKGLLRQIFEFVPRRTDWTDTILATMELRHSSGRRIYKHDALRWWERCSVRSFHVFETSWTESLHGTFNNSDFITEGEEFRKFIVKLLKPTVEDLETAVQMASTTPNLQTWWKDRLNQIVDPRLPKPKVKSELHSLLVDENRLTTHFVQHADGERSMVATGESSMDALIPDSIVTGAGLSERDLLADSREKSEQRYLADLVGNEWVAAGLEEESNADDVRIDVGDDTARPSMFDS